MSEYGVFNSQGTFMYSFTAESLEKAREELSRELRFVGHVEVHPMHNFWQKGQYTNTLIFGLA